MSLKIGEQPITTVFKGNIVLERAYRGPKLVYKTGKSFVTVEPLTATENGTYTAPKGKAYSPVTVNVQPPLGYLTFGNIAYLSVTDPVWDGTMYISDDAEQWSEWDGTRFESGSSHKIYLRGSGNTQVSQESHSFTFEAYNSNAGVTCEGNIETLLDAATVARGEHPTMNTKCYANMFQGCTSLTTAPSLPATTLVLGCYQGMFYGCTSLTTAPVLPATKLASNCYSAMFLGCTSLTTAPTLPATTLEMGCYSSMFRVCESLTTAPELPATTLANLCYSAMFRGCTKLTTLPVLPATTLATRCYVQMFDGCSLIKLSSTSTGDYTTPYRIPFQGTGTTATDALYQMFSGTGGTFTGTPNRNKTYYTSNAIPELTKLTANGMHNVAQYTYAEVAIPVYDGAFESV